MGRKAAGVLSILLSGAWWIATTRDFFKAAALDWVAHFLNQHVDYIGSVAIQYGPPIVLGLVGLYLLASPNRSEFEGEGRVNKSADGIPVEPLVSVPEKMRQTPEGEKRIFVNVAPNNLRSLYEGRTRMEGNRLAEPYIGKWMAVSGKLHDTRLLSNGSLIVTFVEQPELRWIFMVFDNSWKNRLEIISRNQEISIIGKISEIAPHDIYLAECELAN